MVCNSMMLMFCVIACWGLHINARDRSLNRLVRGAGSVIGSTLDRVQEVEKVNLTCFNMTDPDSVDVDHIYNGLVDTGFLWKGKPSDILLCYNTSTPVSSRCVPCIVDLNKTVLVVCKGISETVHLVMETQGGHTIVLNTHTHKTDCPSFTKPSDLKSQKATELPEVSRAGQVPWWVWLMITLGVIMVFLCVLVYKKKSILAFVRSRFCTPDTPAGDEDRPMGVVSEVSPMMNGVSVDKPDEGR